MPHSSGGGHHGGGHHGGSHHSSRHGRSGSSSGAGKISNTPYPGARRYRYRHRGGYRYFYTTRQPGQIFSWGRMLIGVVYIPFIAVGIGLIAAPVKQMFVKYDKSIVIKDEADVLDDDTVLLGSLQAFCDKTGVPPAVVTVHNEDWSEGYGNLEDYAYDRYLAEFSDEMHWLIVYSEPKEPDPNDIDWFWAGMQGDDTDPVITDSVAAVFNVNMQQKLENTSSSVSQDIAESLDLAAERAHKLTIFSRLRQMLPGLGMLLFVGFHGFIMTGLYEFKYRKAELDPDDTETNIPAGPPIPDMQMQQQQRFGQSPQYGQNPAFAQPQQYSQIPQYGAPTQAVPTTQRSTEMDTLEAVAMPQQTQPAQQPVPQPVQTAQPMQPEQETCRYCGANYIRGVKYCPNCGASLLEFRRDDDFYGG